MRKNYIIINFPAWILWIVIPLTAITGFGIGLVIEIVAQTFFGISLKG